MQDVFPKSVFCSALTSNGVSQEEADVLYDKLHKYYVSMYINKASALLKEEERKKLFESFNSTDPNSIINIIMQIDVLLKDNPVWKNKLKFAQDCQVEAFNKLALEDL